MNINNNSSQGGYRRRLFIIFVFLFWCLAAFSQQSSVFLSTDDSISSNVLPFSVSQQDPLYTSMIRPSITPEWHSMITNIPGDLKSLGTSLFHKENVPLLAGVMLTTLGLRTVDKQIWEWTKPNFNRYRSSSSFNKYLVEIGDGRTQFAIAGAFAAYGFIVDDHRALRTASQSVEAILVTGLVVQVLKRITGRESPYEAANPYGIWRLFSNPKEYERHPSRYYSFPSGHTATTMALLTVISQNYPECQWIKPVGLVLVGLVEFGLVNSGMHWCSDFPLAMMLGYTCGRIVSDPAISRDDGITIVQSSNITFKPVITPVGTEIGVSLHF
ncbi:MAG: phosphatase PAP2 family protein [Bacteroidota bacterium]